MTKKKTQKKKTTTKKKVVTIPERESKTNQKGFSLLARIAVSLEKQNDIYEEMIKRLDKWEKMFMNVMQKEEPEMFAEITKKADGN